MLTVRVVFPTPPLPEVIVYARNIGILICSGWGKCYLKILDWSLVMAGILKTIADIG
jgi:hypothetical protein